jgi:hypothetical protein
LIFIILSFKVTQKDEAISFLNEKVGKILIEIMNDEMDIAY